MVCLFLFLFLFFFFRKGILICVLSYLTVLSIQRVKKKKLQLSVELCNCPDLPWCNIQFAWFDGMVLKSWIQVPFEHSVMDLTFDSALWVTSYFSQYSGNVWLMRQYLVNFLTTFFFLKSKLCEHLPNLLYNRPRETDLFRHMNGFYVEVLLISFLSAFISIWLKT